MNLRALRSTTAQVATVFRPSSGGGSVVDRGRWLG